MESLEDLQVRLLGDGRSYESMITQAIGSTQKLGQAIASQSQQLGAITQSLSRLGSTASGIVGSLAANLGIGSFLGTIQTAISKAAETESIEMAFKSLIGDAKLAQATLKDLRDFAVSTPFEMPQILEAAKSMLAYGQSAETIVPTMQRLGDVASALNIPLSSLTYLYGTLKSSGRVMTVDMRQFANRGIPIWLELAKVIGMVTKDTRELTGAQSAQLQQMVTKGQVNFDMIEKAFISMTSEGGRFFNMMKDQSLTFNGIVSNIKDSMGLLLADIGKQLIEGFDMKRILAEIREIAQAFSDWFKNMNPGLKQTIFLVAAVVAGLALVTAAVITLITLFSLLAPLLSPWVLVFAVLAAEIGIVMAVWLKHVGGVSAALDLAKQKLQEFWEFIEPIRANLESLWYTVSIAGQEAWNNILAVANEVWGKITSNFNVNWTGIRDKIAEGILFAEFTIKNLALVWDAAWKGMRYAAIVALNTVLENIILILAGPVILPVLALMSVNWQKLWDGMIRDSALGIGSIASNFAKLAEMFTKILKGENVNIADFMKWDFVKQEFEGESLPTGIEIKALKDLEEKWKKDWEAAGGAVMQSFEDFKKNRTKELAEAAKIEDPIKNNVKKVEEVAKAHKAAVKEITKFDQVLMGSTESFARIMDYRSRFLTSETVAGLAKAAVANTAVAAAAVTSPATSAPMSPAVTPPVEHRGGWFGEEAVQLLGQIKSNTDKDNLGRPVVAGASQLDAGEGGDGGDFF